MNTVYSVSSLRPPPLRWQIVHPAVQCFSVVCLPECGLARRTHQSPLRPWCVTTRLRLWASAHVFEVCGVKTLRAVGLTEHLWSPKEERHATCLGNKATGAVDFCGRCPRRWNTTPSSRALHLVPPHKQGDLSLEDTCNRLPFDSTRTDGSSSSPTHESSSPRRQGGACTGGHARIPTLHCDGVGRDARQHQGRADDRCALRRYLLRSGAELDRANQTR
jgi:hypothetical protein